MFSKKRKQQEIATQKGLGLTPPVLEQQLQQQQAQLAQARAQLTALPPPHQRTISTSTTASNAPPLVSPLQMTFDFEIPPTSGQHLPSPLRETRPQTSDGVMSGNKNGRGMLGAAPLLPKIPRVASNNDMRSESSEAESVRSTPSMNGRSKLQKKQSNPQLPPMPPPEPPAMRFDSDNISTSSSKSRRKSRIKSFFGFEPPPDLPDLDSFPRPSSSSSVPKMPPPPPPVVPIVQREPPSRPGTSGGSPMSPMSPIHMEPSLFPARGSSSPTSPAFDANAPPMSRAWVDARDRGYGPPPAAAPKRPPPPQPTQSSPDLGMAGRSASTNFSKRSPLSGGESPSTTFTRPAVVAAASSPLLQRPPSNAATSYSGSTARSTMSSKSTAVTDSAPTITVGTPYGETSPSFPLPQHVATRPKTAGTGTSKIAGVSIPTHHTSQMADSAPLKPTEKAERRKTRLLNPLNLLSRRRSAQEEEALSAERQAQAAALQRQRNVAATGFVRKLPDDYDPRIRGSGVHDFSAPKMPSRGMSYSSDPDSESMRSSTRGLIPTPLIMGPSSQESGRSSAQSGPKLTFVGQSFHHSNKYSSSTSDSGSTGRRTTGFQEHLGDDSPAGRVQAERLENKDFLQRASYLSQQSSIVSQESAVLPPFARRSQVWESLNPQLGKEDDGSRPGSGQSRKANANAGHGQRDSGVSSVSGSGVSPVTVGSAAMAGAAYDTHTSLSPVSPSSDRRESKGSSGTRISGVSAGSSKRDRIKSSGASSSNSSDAPPPAPSPMPSYADARGGAPNDSPAPKTSPRPPISITIPLPPAPARSPPEVPPPSHSYAAMSPLSTINSPTLDIHSDAPTPEPQIADSVRYSQIPTNTPAKPKLVEKKSTAAGHSSNKRTPSNGIPRHHVSNASRFSFQMGGSAAEELALEEKARKLRQNGEGAGNAPGDEEDEDDFFDEDAMDDMDEMEMQDHDDDQPGGLQVDQFPMPTGTSPAPGGVGDRASQFLYRPAGVTDKRISQKPPRHSALDLQIDPYDSGESEDDEEPYWMHEDFLGYDEGEQSKRESEVDGLGVTTNSQFENMAAGSRQRGASASSGLALAPIDTNLANGGSGKNGFYMQPHAAVGYPTPPTASSATAPIRRPDRDSSGSSDRIRGFAGLNFTTTSLSNGQPSHHAQHTPAMSSSTVGGTSSSSETRTLSTGLGLSGFSDFKFIDSAPNSRPTSLQTDGKENQNRRTKDSDTVPEDINWTAESGKPSPALRRTGRDSSTFDPHFGRAMGSRRPSSPLVTVVTTRPNEVVDDDMYFDDGGFDQDVNFPPPPGEAGGVGHVVDEDAFDDDDFLARNSGAAPQPVQLTVSHHLRSTSALTTTSLGSDGPYPSFAMPNANVARLRDSQLLLEDLPLQGPLPVDPKLIPRRNPSEDAKRLGLSSRAPPLPPQGGSADAEKRVLDSLTKYHAALAEAANRAASEGRFLRAPSQKTMDSQGSEAEDNFLRAPSQRTMDSQGSGVGGLLSQQPSMTSQYSREMEGEVGVGASGDPVQGHNLPNDRSIDLPGQVPAQTLNLGTLDSQPPKLSFDFGFDTLGALSHHPISASAASDDFSYDAYLPTDADEEDDDIVAAANAEALASDDAAFYGQEFGFYAHARPNSGDLSAINGGYFGQDGDDGLARNKSLREPNLTPITERSEFSTRNSFIGGSAGGWPVSAGGASFGGLSPALARLPPHHSGGSFGEGEITSFEELRKLRAHAFGGSNGSLDSAGTRGSQSSLLVMREGESPTLSVRSSGGTTAPGYFGGPIGGAVGGAPMSYAYSTDSNASSGSHHLHQQQQQHQQIPPHQQFAMSSYHDSPHSASASASSHHYQSSLPFSTTAGIDNDATPRKPVHSPSPRQSSPISQPSPQTARKAAPSRGYVHGHSRNSSGADSVTYVKETDPEGGGAPRWVLERRRTSEAGDVELVGREVVSGGWI